MSDGAENVLVINEKLTIPLSELTFRFSTSGGPGGQHANRAETRVTVLFDVAASPSLPEELRQQLLKRLSSRLDREGVLAVTAQESRSQHRNRELALARLQQLLDGAMQRRKRRIRTRPGRAAQEGRLEKKRRRSEKKRERRWRWE